LARRPDDAAAPMDVAAELGGRFGATGETDSLGFLFGPTDAGMMRMALALDAGEPNQAVQIARQIQPERHPFLVNRSHYWVLCGRAFTRVRGHHDEAVMALRKAEDLFPAKVLRNPIVGEVLGELLTRSRRDSSIDRELRGMAYRAGLLV
jgi:hypothetical protein